MILIAIVFWCVSFYIFLDKHKIFNNILLKIILSVFLSFSILSLSFSVSLFTGLNFNWYQITFIIIPITFSLINYKYFISKRKENNLIKLNLLNSELVIILFCLLLFTAMFFFNSSRWGKWDAWAIWSLHSKFLIYHNEFANLFTNTISWTHPDYPLMLSSIIASVWKSIGVNSPMVPLFISYITTISLLLLVLSSFLELKIKKMGIICFIVFSSSILLHMFGSQQYSDTLLSTFMLIPIVLVNHIDKNKFVLYFIIIGFFAAINGWIKNEGLIFFIIFFLFFAASYLKNFKYVLFFLVGVILPIIVVIYFKIYYAPSNDLLSESSGNTLNKLIETNRYSTIYDYFIEKIVYQNALLFILLISAISIDFKYCLSFGFKIILTLFIVYIFVYVLTPKDLEWHLDTSLDRVFHHISPAIIYTIFFYFGQKYNVTFIKKDI